MNKINACFTFCILVNIFAGSLYAQDIYLTPFKKIKVGDKEISSISFSSDASSFAAADTKGMISLLSVATGDSQGKIAGTAPALLHDFINDNKNFILLDNAGRLTKFNTENKESTSTAFSKGLKVASLDPSQNYLTFINKENGLEIYDLTASMTSGRIQKIAGMESTLFLGYDRFGQQLAAINKTGDAITWNPLNQQLLRQLKLQSGEYGGSRSVVQSASTRRPRS